MHHHHRGVRRDHDDRRLRHPPPADVAWAQRGKASQGLCDSALHDCVTTWDETVREQLAEMASAGIRTIKMFTTYRGETMADEDTILKVMKHFRDLGGMAVIHCEANHIIEDTQTRCASGHHIGAPDMAATRPSLAETASVAEVLAIAESVGAPVYFVHQSTPDAVQLVAAARRRGLAAFTEIVAHHLLLDDSHYAGEHPERYVCCPPLRPRETVTALGRHLTTGGSRPSRATTAATTPLRGSRRVTTSVSCPTSCRESRLGYR